MNDRDPLDLDKIVVSNRGGTVVLTMFFPKNNKERSHPSFAKSYFIK